MAAWCGKIKVNDSQEGKTTTPLKPINLEDVVSVEVWIEYRGYTVSQHFDDAPDFPISEIVSGKASYENKRWEVQSVKEVSDPLSSYYCL